MPANSDSEQLQEAVRLLREAYGYLLHHAGCERQPEDDPETIFEGDPAEEDCTCIVGTVSAFLATAAEATEKRP